MGYRNLPVRLLECNKLFHDYQRCRQERIFPDVFGECHPVHMIMIRCLRDVRMKERKRNYDQAMERRERLIKYYEEQEAQGIYP